MTIFAKNLEGNIPFGHPGYAYDMNSSLALLLGKLLTG